VCLDAGALAGGFTDCMLQCSARLIYAIEAGYGQLRGRLPKAIRMGRTLAPAIPIELGWFTPTKFW